MSVGSATPARESIVAITSAAWTLNDCSERFRCSRGTEVDLGDRLGAAHPADVDQHRHLHTPALDELDLFEHGPTTGVLAGQRLRQPRQLGEVQRHQGPSDQLRRPAAAAVAGRPVVQRLHQRHRVVVEQRRQHPHHPIGLERRDVTVAPDDEVPVADQQRRPQRIALAMARSVRRMDVVDRHHPGAGVSGDASRVVGAAIVEHDQLVDDAAGPMSSARITLTSGPIVAASSRHGMHTDTVRSPFASASTSPAQSSTSKVRSVRSRHGQLSSSGPPP